MADTGIIPPPPICAETESPHRIPASGTLVLWLARIDASAEHIGQSSPGTKGPRPERERREK